MTPRGEFWPALIGLAERCATDPWVVSALALVTACAMGACALALRARLRDVERRLDDAERYEIDRLDGEKSAASLLQTLDQRIAELRAASGDSDGRAEALKAAADRAREMTATLDARLRSLQGQLERRQDLLGLVDGQLRQRQILLATDILRAEARRIELESTLGEVAAVVHSLGGVAGAFPQPGVGSAIEPGCDDRVA